jgi:hypothetical protein
MAIDQYDSHITIKKYPRKELLEHFGRKNAKKMYRDTTNGEAKHVGYIVAGHWCDIYEVHEWQKVA